MTPKKPKRKAARPKRKPVIPTDDHLEARRRRVIELWSLSDRLIAKELIKEGFFPQPVNARIAIDQAVFEESCRRTISNDRSAIREQWRKPRVPSAEERNESTEEYIARLQSQIDRINERLALANVKDTAYASLMDTLLRYEAAIAKARGADEANDMPTGPVGGEGVPFFGLIFDLDGLSLEAKAQIAKWRRKQ